MFLRSVAGFAVLCILALLSKYLLEYCHIPFPPPLLGMMILFLLLKFKIVPLKLIEPICKFILQNMVVLFVPILVGLMAYKDVLQKDAIAIFSAVFLSMVLTMSLTALAVEGVIKLKRRKGSE